MIVFNAVLMTVIAGVIVGFLTWAICTQYRHAGCAYLRIRHRLQVRVKLVTLDEPKPVPGTRIAL